MNDSSLLDGKQITYQESKIFHISLVVDMGAPVGVMVAGNGEIFSACAYGGEFHQALTEIDMALDTYQERHPETIIIESVSDEVMEVMNLMLEVRRLKPVGENDFNFADTLFWINNPELAHQMGQGLPQ